jgi:alkylation response protein AidB-like acyl-CoA dehydrogenase
LDQLSSQYDFLSADERRLPPANILLGLGNHGLLGLQIEKKYGGMGLGFVDTAKIIEKLASINVSLATIVTTHCNGTYAIANYGTDALKAAYLPHLAAGRALAAFALTEEGVGSHVYALETTAEPKPGNFWSINGTKIWVDSGAWSSVVVTFCRTSSGRAQQEFIAFAVPADAPGVEIGEEVYIMGMKSMVQNQVHFKDVLVSSDKLLGRKDAGLVVANETLDQSRLLMSIKSLGACKRCLQVASAFSKERKIATGILFDNAVTKHVFGDISLGVSVLEIATNRLAQLFDAGHKIPSEILMAVKVYGSDLANRTADVALQLLGGRGYMEQNFVAQIFRDVRSFKLSEGANEALNAHVGSTLAYADEAIHRFLSVTLNVACYSDKLRTLCSSLRQDYLAIKGPSVSMLDRENWLFIYLVRSHNVIF